MSTTVRVSDETHRRLIALADVTGRRIQAIVEEAVVAYEANAFWDEFNTGYERLADDPDHWAKVLAERTGKAPTLADHVSGS